MKKNPISIGLDDATFKLKDTRSKTTPLIGVVCQGTRMVSVVKKDITIDGNDSTEAIINLIRRTEKHVQYVLMDTITFAGFNIADLREIHERTSKPIIALTDKKVNLDSVRTALINRFPKEFKNKIQKIINAGNLFETDVLTAGGASKVYFHHLGIEMEEVKKLLEKLCIDSKLPECLRMAHLIGKIFEKGQVIVD